MSQLDEMRLCYRRMARLECVLRIIKGICDLPTDLYHHGATGKVLTIAGLAKDALADRPCCPRCGADLDDEYCPCCAADRHDEEPQFSD